MRRETPEPWATALVDAGMVDPRSRVARPSLRALADVVGVHTTTIASMVYGDAATSPETVEAVAVALRRDVTEVSAWVGQSRTVRRTYRPPAKVQLLSRKEQDALSDLIVAIAEERETGARNAAPTKPAVSATADEAFDRQLETIREQLRRALEQAVTAPRFNKKSLIEEVRAVTEQYIAEADAILAARFAQERPEDTSSAS